MPFLDAKALETDPEGLDFLRAVLTPPTKGAGSVREAKDSHRPGLTFEVPLQADGRMPLRPAPRKPKAAAPAA